MTDMPVGERQQLAPPSDDSGILGWMRKNHYVYSVLVYSIWLKMSLICVVRI